MTISNHREPLVPPPTPHGSDQKTQSAAGTSSSDMATLPSKTAAVVEKFNKAFCYRPGATQILMPVSDETIFIMSNLARIKGRADLADELRALIL